MTATDESPPSNAPINRDSGVWPTSGPIAGGKTVTIMGSDLTGTSAVTFGGTPGTSITVVNPTTVSVTTPARSAGLVDVVLTTPGGSVTAADAYTFFAAPTIISVLTASGLTSGPAIGGTLVTITGTNLTEISSLTFGGTPGTSINSESASSVTVVTPVKSAGVVDVELTTPGGTVVSVGAYTYVDAPTITKVSQPSGPVAGNTTVTISGINLTGTSKVKFGGVAGKSIKVVSATSVTVVTPAKGVGVVDVELTTPAGGSVTLAGAYTYVELPTIAKVVPVAGPVAGLTSVTITGTNLTNTSVVTFGGIAATSVTVVDSTTVAVVTAATDPGDADVALTTPGGSVTAERAYTFVSAPTISRVVRSAGPVSGGTMVTIFGSNLSNASKVLFGSTPGTSLKVVGPTSVTVVTPELTAGVVDIVLTTPAGGTATLPEAFTFVNAPTITRVMPSAGRIVGQTTVTITGTNLTDTSVVTFGGVAGTNLTVLSSTSVTVVTPSSAAGEVDVVLTTPAGGTATLERAYSFVNTPKISKISPSQGPVAGGTLVTITGTTLTDTSEVTFGGTAATSLTVVSPTSVTVMTPARAAAIVKVVLTTPAGGSVTVAGAYQFIELPIIKSISPASGPVSGKSTVTITGKHLSDTSSVTFGEKPGTSITNVSDTSVTVVTPENLSGVVDVVLTTPAGGTSTSIEAYTFVDSPTITKLSRSEGPVAGRTTLTIAGTNLLETSAVTFGGKEGTSLNILGATSLTVVTPAKTAGNADVVLTTPGGSAKSASAYTFVDAPKIDSVSQSSGPVAGGTLVTITGTALADTTTVTFGGTSATSITNVSATSVTVLTPAKMFGPVDVVLTTRAGGSITAISGYTFVNAPTISDISPLIGPSVGRARIAITGTNLTDTSAVTFGGKNATSVKVESDSLVTVQTPAGAAANVDVTLTTPAGGSVTVVGGYTFVDAPTISRVAPEAGPVSGGTKVMITGTDLTGTSSVKFGDTAGTSISVVSATSVTVVTPAKPVGAANVELVTPGGSVTSVDSYRFVKAPTIAGPRHVPAVEVVVPPKVVAPEVVAPQEVVAPKVVVPKEVVAPQEVVVPEVVVPKVVMPEVVVPEVVVPKVVVPETVVQKVFVPEVVAQMVVEPEVVTHEEEVPTHSPVQGFFSKTRDAIGREFNKPKVVKTPKAPKAKPISSTPKQREIRILVHDAKATANPVVEQRPPKQPKPPKQKAIKRKPAQELQEFADKTRGAIGRWVRKATTPKAKEPEAPKEQQLPANERHVARNIVVYPPRVGTDVPTKPTPKHGE
ncbi:MAG: IPT/TIG domain-containing protein [Bacteroidetes bacterium]|nr:IPT/TIG domain-containing protein [Bacteroidota bacterium]